MPDSVAQAAVQPDDTPATQATDAVEEAEDPTKAKGWWTRPYFEERLLKFYEEHNPSMMEKVPWLLDAHRGRFEKLWKAVLRKYRPSDHIKEPTEAPLETRFQQ